MWGTDRPARQGSKNGSAASAAWLICLCGLALLTGCAPVPTKQQPAEANLFELLKGRGYEPNLGLAGIYEPGNLIQTMAPGDQGGPGPLRTPMVFMWRSDCFPGQKPRVAPFVLPQTSGRSGSAFSLDAGLAQLLLPFLKFDRSVLSDYRVELGDGHVHTLAKGDLSRQFSPRCVDALSRAIADGDHVDWFAVIVEAVVVDGLNIEVSWQASTGAAARLNYLGLVQQQLAAALSAEPAGGGGAGIELAADDARRSVIRADGPVIVGYRVRPLQAVYE